MSAPSLRSEGPLEHLGVSYGDPESLVAATGARVTAALANGDDVYLSVDRRTARTFREHLGSVLDRAEFPSPHHWLRDVVRDLRAMVRRDRRTLVLGQYTATGVGGDDLADVEDSINLVLADLPLTLLCTCSQEADASLVQTLHSGHPDLLVGGAATANPDYREPSPSRPVDVGLWGPSTLRLDVVVPADLHRVREHITRAAVALGLQGETVDDAVQAVHEAAVVATGGLDALAMGFRRGAEGWVGDPSGGTGPAKPCVLEVRADAGVLHCEIVSPRPEITTLPAGTGGDPLHVVRQFSDRALLHDDGDVRSVRVLRVPCP